LERCGRRQHRGFMFCWFRVIPPSWEIGLKVSCCCVLYLKRSPNFPLKALIISHFPNVPKKQNFCDSLFIWVGGKQVG
jgi:hypothetical protein